MFFSFLELVFTYKIYKKQVLLNRLEAASKYMGLTNITKSYLLLLLKQTGKKKKKSFPKKGRAKCSNQVPNQLQIQ
jgi:hypothetical protein